MQQQGLQQENTASLGNLCDRLINSAEKTDFGRSLINYFGIKSIPDQKLFEHLSNLVANAPEFRELNGELKSQLGNIKIKFPDEILDLHYKLTNIEDRIHYTIKEDAEKVKLIFKINSDKAISAAKEVCPGITIDYKEPDFKIPIPQKFAKLRDEIVIELDTKIRELLASKPESTFSLAIREVIFLSSITNEIDTYQKGHLLSNKSTTLSEEMVKLTYLKLKELPKQREERDPLQVNKSQDPFEIATLPTSKATKVDKITEITGVILSAVKSITAGTEVINLEAVIKALRDKDEITIGRSPSCDITIDKNEVSVSKNHLTMRIKNGQLLIKDNNSTNGTYINDIKYNSAEFVLVSNLSNIQLGRNILPYS